MHGIIDAHTHLSERKDDRLNVYADRNGLTYNLEELLRLMKLNDVALGLLLSSIVGMGVPLPNEDVLKLCLRSQGRLLPVITVEPSSKKVRNALQLAKRNEGLVKAFKVMLGYGKVRAGDPVFNPLYDHAESAGLPIMFHTGDTADVEGSLVHAHPLTLDALANKRGDLKIVACHFGNPWIDDVAELIYKHSNVYADISGLVVGGSKYIEQYTDSLAERLSRAIYFAGGADKVIFGSDYPVTQPSVAISLVEKLEIDTKDRERILSENAKRVFRL
ncbi:MAG: amidohydrolase family protein [Nitrososphaerales archaeon]